MLPGEYLFDGEPIVLNADRPTCTVEVNNRGDRPIQVGSHYHFFEVNRALVFDRQKAYGMRLDLPGGTGVRFEPGEIKTVQLVAVGGKRTVYGGSGLVNGPLDDSATRKQSAARLEEFLAGNLPLAGAKKRKDKKKGKKKKKKR